MAANEVPASLPIGTQVSAKYKGAFCEAKVKSIQKQVKVRVTFKSGIGSLTLSDDFIRPKSNLVVGAVVEAKHPEKQEYLESIVNKIQDQSLYTVVFDDGDITTLRRNALCIKSGKHYNASESLDNLPLTHPEHFGTPVSGISKRKKRDNPLDSDHEFESSSEPEEFLSSSYFSQVGRVIWAENTDNKKSKGKDNWFPALIVAPTASDTVKIDTRDEFLIRSFKDGRYYTVCKKDTNIFNRDKKFENQTLKEAMEKAITYLDTKDLPPHWDKELLFHSTVPEVSSSESSESSEDLMEDEEDSNDKDSREDKDHLIAELYKHMEDRGAPINRTPNIVGRDLDLYKLFRVVYKYGGSGVVSHKNKWRQVAVKLGFESTWCTNQVRVHYKRYLQSFEEVMRSGEESGVEETPSQVQRKVIKTKGTPKKDEGKKVTMARHRPRRDSSSKIGVKEEGNKKHLGKSMIDESKEKMTESDVKKESSVDSLENDAHSSSSSSSKPGRKKMKAPPKIPGSSSSSSSSSLSEFRNTAHLETKQHLGPEVEVRVGDKIRVFYIRDTIYDAKVIKISSQKAILWPKYLVHYQGWNARYDEWIQRSRISENLSWNAEDKKKEGRRAKEKKGEGEETEKKKNKGNPEEGLKGSRRGRKRKNEDVTLEEMEDVDVDGNESIVKKEKKNEDKKDKDTNKERERDEKEEEEVLVVVVGTSHRSKDEELIPKAKRGRKSKVAKETEVKASASRLNNEPLLSDPYVFKEEEEDEEEQEIHDKEIPDKKEKVNEEMNEKVNEEIEKEQKDKEKDKEKSFTSSSCLLSSKVEASEDAVVLPILQMTEKQKVLFPYLSGIRTISEDLPPHSPKKRKTPRKFHSSELVIESESDSNEDVFHQTTPKLEKKNEEKQEKKDKIQEEEDKEEDVMKNHEDEENEDDGEKEEKDEVCIVGEVDLDLACGETIPGSPVPSCLPISPTLQLEMPFATRPGSEDIKKDEESREGKESLEINLLDVQVPLPTLPLPTLPSNSSLTSSKHHISSDLESVSKEEGSEDSKLDVESSEDVSSTLRPIKKGKKDCNESSFSKRTKRRTRELGVRIRRKRRDDESQETEESKDPILSSLGSLDNEELAALCSSPSIRSSKYNFYVYLDPSMESSERILKLQNNLEELRRTYLIVKTNLAIIERRRKKIRRKERGASSESHRKLQFSSVEVGA